MKSVQVGRSQTLGNSSTRKSLSAESTRGSIPSPSPPCSCRECKQNSKKVTTKTPRGLPTKNIPNNKGQDKGDYRGQSKTVNNNNNTTVSEAKTAARASTSRQILKTKFFPSHNNKENNICEPNIARKSSSTTFLVKPRQLVYTANNSRSNFGQIEYDLPPPSPKESLVQLYKAPPGASRVSSVTEAVPVLRKNVQGPIRRLTPVVPPSESTTQFFTQRLAGGNSSNTKFPCTCQSKTCQRVEESPDSSYTTFCDLESTETICLPEKSQPDCHQVHPAHDRRVALATSSGKSLNQNSAAKLPPLPPPNPNRVSQHQIQGQGQGSSIPRNRQTTAILSVGANTVGSAHLNNYRPKGISHSSPSFIVETVGSTPDCVDNAPCTLARTLPFSREHELRRPGTSHSTLHASESRTNLHAGLESTSDPCVKCPLCKETKSQVSVHHRSMQSRYMSDLEWRICHAVNIYVYRNGVENQTPILVHIPPARKKNMKNVMAVIQDRMKYPIGYAKTLYKMDGTRIRHPCELEMYNNYVVGSNYDKHFKCVQYGRKRSPLLILARESKHVRVLRQQNEHYDQWLLKKKAAGDERPQYLYPVVYTQDGYGPADLPVGQGGNYQPCGPFCKLPNKRCGPMNHDSCGPGPNRTARQGYQQDYIVNTITIPTGNPRDPAKLLQQRNKLDGDGEYVESPSNNKNSDPTSRRYQSIGKDDESLFYGTKPRKKSKGVIDTSGDKKIFGEVDSNANLVQNEYDEIPDLSDPNPQYNVEQEVYEVVDETIEESPQQPDYQDQNETIRKSRTKQINETKSSSRNNESISATSRSYTIVSKTTPPVQQGGTQTRKPSKPGTNSKSKKTREGQTGSPNSNGVSFFVPIDEQNGMEQHNERAQTLQTVRTPQVEASNSAEESISGTSQGFHASGTAGGFDQHQDQQQQQSWNDQNQSNNKNYIDNNMMLNQQNHPIYQAAMLNQGQGSPFRPFIIDGSARFGGSTGPYFASCHPEPQENFANQYDELSDIMAGTDEVDIPFTPLQNVNQMNNTFRQQPLPNFYPPYQDYRFLPNVYNNNNGFNNNNNNNNSNNMGGNFNKVTIDKPKFRNVATQFGKPSFEEIGPPTYKNSTQGQQQMLQDSLQNQQMRMQQAIIQQQQLAQMSGQSGQMIYPSPVYLSPAGSGQQQVQYVQQPQQQQQQQQSWNNNSNNNYNRIQMQQPTGTTTTTMQQQRVCVPPPTQYQDLGNRQNIRHPVAASIRRTSSNNITQPRKSEATMVQGGKKSSQRGQPNGGRIS